MKKRRQAKMIDKYDATMPPETQEDEQDAKDGEEARQDLGERITLEEYIAKREQRAKESDFSERQCEDVFFVVGADGQMCIMECMLPGVHSVHMARGSSADGELQKRVNWKLIWEEERAG